MASQDMLRQVNCLFEETNVLYHEAALKLGLSDSAMLVLYTIYSSGEPCPLSRVYKESGISRQTVNSAVRKLEGQEILFLEAGPGRGKLLRLTQRGKQVMKTRVMPIAELEQSIFSSWSEENRQTFLRLNQNYLDALREGVKTLQIKEDPE